MCLARDTQEVLIIHCWYIFYELAKVALPRGSSEHTGGINYTLLVLYWYYIYELARSSLRSLPPPLPNSSLRSSTPPLLTDAPPVQLLLLPFPFFLPRPLLPSLQAPLPRIHSRPPRRRRPPLLIRLPHPRHPRPTRGRRYAEGFHHRNYFH